MQTFITYKKTDAVSFFIFSLVCVCNSKAHDLVTYRKQTLKNWNDLQLNFLKQM